MKRVGVLSSALAAAALAVAAAQAGQVRVNVTGSNTFAPDVITLNNGDHVCWVWTGGAHTVTSGVDGDDPLQGQIFDSGFLGPTLPAAFSWKADRTGNVNYFCAPHWSGGMVGLLQINSSGISVSSFRITEVQYNHPSGLDRIEIANLGGDFGDLGRYRLAINASTSVIVPLNSVSVLQGTGRVVIHTNQAGTNTQTELYMPTIGDLPASGSVALYVPNTKPGTSLADATQIIDFVQWGAGGQPNLATAIAAGVWPSSEFVPAVPEPSPGQYDLAFCGTASQRGASFWQVATPNFRSAALCATPTRTTTWGRLKVLYR